MGFLRNSGRHPAPPIIEVAVVHLYSDGATAADYSTPIPICSNWMYLGESAVNAHFGQLRTDRRTGEGSRQRRDRDHQQRQLSVHGTESGHNLGSDQGAVPRRVFLNNATRSCTHRRSLIDSRRITAAQKHSSAIRNPLPKLQCLPVINLRTQANCASLPAFSRSPHARRARSFHTFAYRPVYR